MFHLSLFRSAVDFYILLQINGEIKFRGDTHNFQVGAACKQGQQLNTASAASLINIILCERDEHVVSVRVLEEMLSTDDDKHLSELDIIQIGATLMIECAKM